MLYAWIGDEKRAPRAKGERTICRDCGGLLSAVMPVENVPHWRHKAGDCDPWSEPEGPWHLGWKERFDLSCREISLIHGATGERHRADVLCGTGTPKATVLAALIDLRGGTLFARGLLQAGTTDVLAGPYPQ